jgi:hypothetical protein
VFNATFSSISAISWRPVLVIYKVYQLLAHGRWFSPGTSSTTKTGRHDIAEILLKVALNTKIQIHSKTKVGGRLLFYQQKNEQILFHHRV